MTNGTTVTSEALTGLKFIDGILYQKFLTKTFSANNGPNYPAISFEWKPVPSEVTKTEEKTAGEGLAVFFSECKSGFKESFPIKKEQANND